MVSPIPTNIREIHAGEPTLGHLEKEFLADVLARNWLTQGKYVERFEREFAEFLGVKYAIACSSGTAALHLALASIGIRPGDEVILPTLTFVATANAVSYLGATPIFVDVNPETWCIDVKQAEMVIGRKTRAIIPVHLYGACANMNAIMELAEKYQLYIVEDAAEALGANFLNFPAGSIGDAGCFSFYGNKTITTGEGGMMVTDNEIVADFARKLRGQGQTDKRYFHDVIGFNYRMTDLQAAVGCGQMAKLPEILEKRTKIAIHYHTMLTLAGFEFQKWTLGNIHGNWAVVAMVPRGCDRDEIMRKMKIQGVETRPTFHPMHTLPMYRKLIGRHEFFPVAEDVARRGIVLPTHAQLDEKDVDYVVEILQEAIYG